MDDLMNDGTIPLLVITAIALVVIWQAGAHWRAKTLASREAEYRALAGRALRVQEVAGDQLARITDQIAEFNNRMSVIEGILKDVE